MPTNFSKLLTSLGLSATETKVYLANLELGPTSVQDIAKKAGISRTAGYDLIGALQEYGLVSTFKQGKKTFFSAEDPERAMSYFRSRIRKQRSRLEEFERLMPELKLIMGGERPVVRFYEGKEALFALFSDLASTRAKQFDEVSNYEDIYKFLDVEYIKEVQKIIDPARIHTRILHRGKLQREPREHVEYHELKQGFGNFHGDVWIYANRVAFISFRGKITAVLLESEDFANTARVIFEVAWQASVE